MRAPPPPAPTGPPTGAPSGPPNGPPPPGAPPPWQAGIVSANFLSMYYPTPSKCWMIFYTSRFRIKREWAVECLRFSLVLLQDFRWFCFNA